MLHGVVDAQGDLDNAEHYCAIDGGNNLGTGESDGRDAKPVSQ